MKIKINKKSTLFTILVFYFLVAYFNRSLVGIMIFDFRLGEFIVLFGLLLSLFFFISGNIGFKNNKILLFYRLIILSFLISLFLNNGSFVSSYTYKSSSYIWMVSYIFLGKYFSKHKLIPSSSYLVLGLLPLFSYIFSTGNYPNFIIDFFNQFSDKFQFTKASDSFHLILIVCLFISFYINKVFYKLLFIYTISFLFLPLLLYQSRGSFVGIILFLLLESFYFRKYIVKNLKSYLLILLISSIALIFTLYRVSDIDFFEFTEEPVQNITSTSSQIIENKDTLETLFSFYYLDGRIFSTDSTTNWRLDIWQDVIEDLNLKGKNLIGYGYNEVIPIMLDGSAPGRLGRDGMNEHVHNYFFTIISRGGYVQLIFFLSFYFYLIKEWYSNSKNLRIFSYLVPVFFVSFLDISMDGVHFPLIFFLTLGYMLTNKQIQEIYGAEE